MNEQAKKHAVHMISRHHLTLKDFMKDFNPKSYSPNGNLWLSLYPEVERMTPEARGTVLSSLDTLTGKLGWEHFRLAVNEITTAPSKGLKADGETMMMYLTTAVLISAIYEILVEDARKVKEQQTHH
ncbi:MAG TPA: hypothetical protein VLI92_00020 [Candidatus Saccharimonadales bacterium]|nr:hypothetical protein [Candidatus Saccharimonadales bacterium]